MDTDPDRPARALRRAGLSRERVLAAAVALADEGGVEELSMRKLARKLGVEAMSLYNHIANKDHLLDGMVDFVVGEIEPPSPSADWKQEIRRSAILTRDALNRHRWAIGLLDARPGPGGASARLHEAGLACLREAGVSADGATHALAVQDAYTYGYALREATRPSILDSDGSGHGQEFLFGLDLILDALEEHLAAGRRAS